MLHYNEHSEMEDRLKFTDLFEEIPRIPRKLKRKLFEKKGRDPLTHYLYQKEEMTRDGKTKTTIEDEDKDHIGVHRNRPLYLQTYVVHDDDAEI